MSLLKNKDLKEIYNKIYEKGKEKFFSFDNTEETEGILNMIDWKDKKVIEIGCGEGDLAVKIKDCAAKKVIGIDYSKEAIEIARKKEDMPSLGFFCIDYKNVDVKSDIIVMQGVLEHLNDPFEALDFIFENYEPETIITSSPSFLNPRGYIWMALQTLFDVPMSKTDLHQLNVWEFKEYCRKRGYKLTYKSEDRDWGCHYKMIKDFDKRLRNALSDIGKYDKEKVDRFLEWLKNTFQYTYQMGYCGATMIYKITRNSHEN